MTYPARFELDYDRLGLRDKSEKETAKSREDKKRKARGSRIEAGDTVVLKREVRLKGESKYSPERFEVIKNLNGSLIMRASDGRTVQRYITFAKRCEGNQDTSSGEDEDEEADTEDEAGGVQPQDQDENNERRMGSTRLRKAPAHLKDFIFAVSEQ